MFLDRNTAKYFKAFLGSTGEGTYRVPQLDATTHVLEVITDVHHEIHEEKSFTAYYARTTDATDTHRSGLYIKTPVAGPECHMVFSGACSTAANLSISEAPTIDANAGSHAGVVYNRYRKSTEASIVFDNATSPAVNKFTTLDETAIAGGSWNAGTVLRSFPLATGSGPKPAGGVDRGMQEYILKPDTAYVLLLTNTAASANDHLLQMDWYEHLPLKA